MAEFRPLEMDHSTNESCDDVEIENFWFPFKVFQLLKEKQLNIIGSNNYLAERRLPSFWLWKTILLNCFN